jgi:hypothetical protein
MAMPESKYNEKIFPELYIQFNRKKPSEPKIINHRQQINFENYEQILLVNELRSYIEGQLRSLVPMLKSEKAAAVIEANGESGQQTKTEAVSWKERVKGAIESFLTPLAEVIVDLRASYTEEDSPSWQKFCKVLLYPLWRPIYWLQMRFESFFLPKEKVT